LGRKTASVSLVGLGYVGLCTAVSFASRGFNTLGVDIDRHRVEQIGEGHAPLREPGLDKLLKLGLQSKRLKITSDVAKTAETDVIFITVGTPSNQDGSINLGYVKSAAQQIGTSLRDEQDYRLVVVKSTVTPGTTSSTVKPTLEETTGKKVGVTLGLCANPEFLREGSAIKDALHPDKLVIGAADKESGNHLTSIYRAFYKRKLPPTIVTTPDTAELIKYASNAFLAAKVSYINTIANIAQQIPGVDVEKVAEAIGLDPRIGRLFLKAGPGFGGSCFHKDLQAIIAFSTKLGYKPTMLDAIEEVNEEQAARVVRLAENLSGPLTNKRVAILGLAFKKDTDDIREAASIRVIANLKKKGAQIVAYDPEAMPNAKQVLGDNVEYAAEAKSAIKGADCCIIMTEWEEFRKLKSKDYAQTMRTPNILDARRLYHPEDFEGLNFLAIGLGQGLKPLPEKDSSPH
jgi:UDPglucose 6-dehydrogenase